MKISVASRDRRRRRALMVLLLGVLQIPLLLSGAAAQSPRQASKIISVPQDQGADGAWWFSAWQIEKVWQLGARGQGIVVAVVGSGVDAELPEFAGHVLPGTDFKGGDGRSDSAAGTGHGTGMARLIVGQGPGAGRTGIAPAAQVLPIARNKFRADTAIRWAADHGANVINLSIGSTHDCSALTLEAEAVRYAVEKNIVVVAAAGNEGRITDIPSSPADCPGVFAVGSVDVGLNIDPDSSPGANVSAAAPGVRMINFNASGKARYTEGTSNSAAVTSAAVALVWSKYPELTNRQVVDRLIASARDVGPPGRDDRSGYGVIRPYQAITEPVPAEVPNPVFGPLDAMTQLEATQATPGATAGEGLEAVAEGSDSGGTRSAIIVILVAGLLLCLVVVVIAVLVMVVRRSGSGPPPGPPTLQAHPHRTQ